MTVRAIIFDLGHTLWDVTPQPEARARAYAEMREALVRRLSRHDLPQSAAFQSAVHDVLHAAGQTYATNGAGLREPPPHEWVGQACLRLGLEVDEWFLREISPPLFATEIGGLVVGEGTWDAVVALAAAGYRLGCVTNTLADTAAIRAMLRKHRFESLMQSVVVSTEVGWRKPHGLPFERAAAELDVSSDEAVFVGDSPLHDIGGAKAAGMFAVLTTQYVTRPYPDDTAAPDARVNHLRELAAIVPNLR